MGGGLEHQQEHLLIILPLREPTSILQSFKRQFPYITVTFKSTVADHGEANVDIPAGSSQKRGILRHAVLLLTPG